MFETKGGQRQKDLADAIDANQCIVLVTTLAVTTRLYTSFFLFLISVLRKDFDTPPYSQQIELGKQAELRCHPPKGNPPPRVIHWLKDGVEIKPKTETNFIQSATGNLLIIQARMEDSGNYTCVVSNDVLTRNSPEAVVTIYGKFQLDYGHKLPSQTRLDQGRRQY